MENKEPRSPLAIPQPRPARPASNHHWTMQLFVFELIVGAAFAWWLSSKGAL